MDLNQASTSGGQIILTPEPSTLSVVCFIFLKTKRSRAGGKRADEKGKTSSGTQDSRSCLPRIESATRKIMNIKNYKTKPSAQGTTIIDIDKSSDTMT